MRCVRSDLLSPAILGSLLDATSGARVPVRQQLQQPQDVMRQRRVRRPFRTTAADGAAAAGAAAASATTPAAGCVASCVASCVADPVAHLGAGPDAART